MYSLSDRRWASALIAIVVATTQACSTQADAKLASAHEARGFRVCADPNNLPFSNDHGEGFENRIAELMAKDAGAKLEYKWWPQRRGFARNTLRANECDVIMGVPTSYELAWTTEPYYRSTYVFVSRDDRGLDVKSLDDKRLRKLSIGVHMIGDDYSNTPAAQSLAQRGIIENVKGYSIYGDYSKPDPPADLMRAVVDGSVDIAIVWGPLAGYFARHTAVPLRLQPVTPQIDLPFMQFVYDISAGVRRGDSATHALVERELELRHDDIQRILQEYGVPLLDPHNGNRVIGQQADQGGKA